MGKIINRLKHTANNVDVKEVCEDYHSLLTHDKVPIKKILIANIDPATTHKLLVNTFKKFGKIVHCILKRQKDYGGIEGNEGNIEENVEGESEEQNQLSKKRNSYAFITYTTVEEAQKAIQAGYNREISIKKQYLRVLPANSWNQPDNPEQYNKRCNPNKSLEIDLDRSFIEINAVPVEDGSLINRMLNNDCLRYIFNLLPFYDRVRIERVSKYWKMVSEDAWHDQHKLNFDPNNWGSLSTEQTGRSNEILRSPEASYIYKILKKCKDYITHIDLSTFSDQLGNSTLIKLANMCTHLQSINLKNFQFSHSGIKALTTCSNLRTITIGYTQHKHKFDKELALLLSESKKLKQVDIDCFIIEGHCLRHLPKKSLQELILRESNYVLRNGIHKTLEKLKNLQAIKIIGFPEPFDQYPDFIKSICSCSKLEVIEIPREGSLEPIDLNWQVLEPITNLRNLTKINLKGNTIVENEFLMLLCKSCWNLTSVDISDCHRVRNNGLDSVTSLPKLEHLCVDTLAEITDIVFSKSMPNIKTLLCSGCVKIQPFGLAVMLQSAKQLEILDLTDCKLITNSFILDTIKLCRTTKRCKCLTIYLRGTSVQLEGINREHCWNYLQLFKTQRPGELFLYHY